MTVCIVKHSMVSACVFSFVLNSIYFNTFFGRNVKKAYFFAEFMFILITLIGKIYIIIL